MVEDDIGLAGLYKMRLLAEGFTVRHCVNGEAALQAAQEFHPNLILLDIMMPRVNGFDVLDILHNTPGMENVKIVILTAMGDIAAQDKARSLGADDYLIKSQVMIDDVAANVRSHLGLPPKLAR